MSISSILVVGLGSNAFGNVTTVKPLVCVENSQVKVSVHDNYPFGMPPYSKEPLSLVEFRADLSAQSLRDVLGVSATWNGTTIVSRGCATPHLSVAAASELPYEVLSICQSKSSNGRLTEAGISGVSLKCLQLSSHKRPADILYLGGSLRCATSGKPLVDHVLSASCESENNLYVIRKESNEPTTVELVSLTDDFAVCTPVPFPFASEQVVHLSCGRDHTLFLGASGNVYSTGLGTRGQLGHGCLKTSKIPRLVEALAGVPMAEVSCGGWHSLALSTCGDVYSWGWNCNRQLGIWLPEDRTNTGSGRTPEVVALPTLLDLPGGQNVDFVSISAGTRHSVAVSNKGVVWGWGWSAYGQLGCSSDMICPPQPIPLASYTADAWLPRLAVCGPWNTFIVLTRPADVCV